LSYYTQTCPSEKSRCASWIFVRRRYSQWPQYPYALNELTRLARDSWADPSFQELVAGFPEETRRDADSLIAHVEHLTKNDIKAVYLKQLQGRQFRLFSPFPRLVDPCIYVPYALAE
jgi:hypothetical protein